MIFAKFVSVAVSPQEDGSDTLYAVDVIGQVWMASEDGVDTIWTLLPRPPVPEGFANGTRRFREKRTTPFVHGGPSGSTSSTKVMRHEEDSQL